MPVVAMLGRVRDIFLPVYWLSVANVFPSSILTRATDSLPWFSRSESWPNSESKTFSASSFVYTVSYVFADVLCIVTNAAGTLNPDIPVGTSKW